MINVFMSLKIVIMLANSVDPVELQPRYLICVFTVYPSTCLPASTQGGGGGGDSDIFIHT